MQCCQRLDLGIARGRSQSRRGCRGPTSGLAASRNKSPERSRLPADAAPRPRHQRSKSHGRWMPWDLVSAMTADGVTGAEPSCQADGIELRMTGTAPEGWKSVVRCSLASHEQAILVDVVRKRRHMSDGARKAAAVFDRDRSGVEWGVVVPIERREGEQISRSDL